MFSRSHINIKETILKIQRDKNIQTNKLQYFFKKKENKDLLGFINNDTQFLLKKWNDISFWEKLYCILNDIKEIKTCHNKNCSNHVNFQFLNLWYAKFCSYKCSSTSNETKEKRRQYNIKHYWVENISQIEDIKIKKIQTTRKNFNVDYPWQSDIVYQKRLKTNIEKYGYKNWLKSSIIKTVKKYNDTNINSLYQDISYNFDTYNYVVFCKKCKYSSIYDNQSFIHNRLFVKKSNICYSCNPINNNVSNIEHTLHNFIKEIYTWIIITNDRKVLEWKEIDIYLKDLNIGIELNWLYWHSEKFHEKDQDYQKYVKCKNKGIELFQFFEDELIIAMEMIYSKLKLLNVLRQWLDIDKLNNQYGLSIIKKVFYTNNSFEFRKNDKNYTSFIKRFWIDIYIDNFFCYYWIVSNDELLTVFVLEEVNGDLVLSNIVSKPWYLNKDIFEYIIQDIDSNIKSKKNLYLILNIRVNIFNNFYKQFQYCKFLGIDNYVYCHWKKYTNNDFKLLKTSHIAYIVYDSWSNLYILQWVK